MRKFALYLTAFVLMSVSLTSCESLFNNCMLCRQVTLDNGNVINETAEAEYCGLDLAAIQATAPNVSGSTTIKWECR